jgi:FkbM family methyltransferase
MLQTDLVGVSIKKLDWYRSALQSLGVSSLIRLQIQKRFWLSNLSKLTSKTLSYPVFARPNTSDFLVFDQIFVEREYRCLDEIKKPKLVVDCGANVGYSSVYFLSKYPECFVIAVEPDANNFAILEKNLSFYRGRYDAIQAALWPRAEKLQFNNLFSNVGQEWARRVEKVAPSVQLSEHIKTVDIGTLIKRSRFDRVSILKIDIEGAEGELFSSAIEWLDLVDNIVIELHGQECHDAFFRAIRGRRFSISTRGELTVCLGQDSDPPVSIAEERKIL